MKSTVDRRDEILSLLNENGKVKVDELRKKFDVSAVTIRNDLDYLEKKGILHRTFGGALLHDLVATDSSLTEKQKLHAEEKRRIGIEAAKMIRDGDSFILDSGTTIISRNRKREIGKYDDADDGKRLCNSGNKHRPVRFKNRMIRINTQPYL